MPAPAFTLEIGGEDVTAFLVADSLEKEGNASSRGVMAFTLVDPAGEYSPETGAEVELFDENDVLLFGGTIEEPAETLVTKRGIGKRIDVTAVGFTQLGDRFLVAELFEAQTCGAIVESLRDEYLAAEGVTAGVIEDGPIVTIPFNYRTVKECLEELAEQAGGFVAFIDKDKQLHFRSRAAVAAPVTLETGSVKNIVSIRVRRPRSGYRNRQYLRAGLDKTASRTEHFKGDGTNKVVTVSFPVSEVPSVTVGGVSKTVGIKGVTTGKDWYWNRGERVLSQDDAAAAVTNGTAIAITYVGEYPLIVMGQDDLEISARAAVEGGSGVYEAIETDEAVDTGTLAIAKVLARLKQGRLVERLEVVTYERGFEEGQIATVVVPELGINGEYLIETAVSRFENDVVWMTRLELLGGDTLGGWVNFFRKMTREGKYVVRENEVLQLVRGFSETLALTESLLVSVGAPETRIGYLQLGYGEIG